MQRQLFRHNKQITTTSGLCPNYLQVNMLTLPYDYAFEFLLFCNRNPKSCPIIEVLEPGVWSPVTAEADIRTDLPKYHIYEHGRLVGEELSIKHYWRDDLVTFLIGCSFTFEKALLENNIRLLHQEQNKVVPMYKTNIECHSSGIFKGNMVVSMRALEKDQIDKAIKITSQFSNSHGSPVHVGNPEEIGIEDINQPDYGESIKFENHRVPVFWACGVTPQNICLNAKPSLAISHAPGHMLITDQLEKLRA